MGISWGALAGAFLAPFLYSMYSKKITRPAVWASFIFGVGVMVIDMFCNFTGRPFINAYFSSPINAGVLAMVGGLIIVPIVSAFTKVNNTPEVDKMFKNYAKLGAK
ncbi:MAG: sodium:solute symporter, partial [Oscillospiraceae bacterium]|nr:sodium:solute symporter [Oscillospiraceae bacterium]